jgi:3-oxoacyl-[acyl-carrier protein] reductase
MARVAVVTGGTRGIGEGISMALKAKGYRVAATYAGNDTAAQQFQIKSGIPVFKFDVGDYAACEKGVAQITRNLGPVDVLVNNAGITKFAQHNDLDALDAEDFLRLYKVNVVAVYQMVRAARPHLDKAGGKAAVVNVSSIAGVTGIGSSIAYASTKGALNTMTLSLARALAPSIRVNAVCPGYIASGWFTKYQGSQVEDATAERVIQSTPLKVASQPEDIAETILFFAGPESRHVTGEFIIVDAGMHLGYAPTKAR